MHWQSWHPSRQCKEHILALYVECNKGDVGTLFEIICFVLCLDPATAAGNATDTIVAIEQDSGYLSRIYLEKTN